MTNQTITILHEKTLLIPEVVSVTSVRFVNPTHGLDDLLCNACQKPIGSSRPVTIAWDGHRGYRLCYSCSKGLKETKVVHND